MGERHHGRPEILWQRLLEHGEVGRRVRPGDRPRPEPAAPYALLGKMGEGLPSHLGPARVGLDVDESKKSRETPNGPRAQQIAARRDITRPMESIMKNSFENFRRDGFTRHSMPYKVSSVGLSPVNFSTGLFIKLILADAR